MRITVIIGVIFLLLFQACENRSLENATAWTNEMKYKIIEDASKPSNNIFFDSVRNKVTYLRGKIKLKSYQLYRTLDSNGKISYRDTAASIFYSADQDFELIRELCPINSRTSEGIRYKGTWMGKSELRFCNGKIKNISFSYGRVSVGKEVEYDSIGNIITQTDHGNSELLKKLTSIKYYR